MNLTARQEDVLDSLISEYIRIAQPISSQYLEERYDFGVSPATIRNELQVLSEEGYVAQPHTSAGRVPTDRGYRFFVDGVSTPTLNNKLWGSRKEKTQTAKRWGDVFEKEITDALEFAAHTARVLANESSGLAAMYMEDSSLFFKEGWEDMLQEPEFEEQDSIKSFTRFLNDFEKHVHGMSLENGVQVFIGRENPFSKVTDFSIMIAECEFPEQGRGKVALLGPKRMEYLKNIHLLGAFSKIWNNNQ
jgi:heat-inducible transcriptional repressor